MTPEPLDLQPDEEVLAVAHASFRGAAAASARSTFALGAGRLRLRAFDTWHDAAVASGFPVVPPDMMIAVSDRRVLFGKPTCWGRPPARYANAVDFARIVQVVAVRHGLVTGVAFCFSDGAIVELEAARGRRLRRVVRLIDEHLARRPGS